MTFNDDNEGVRELLGDEMAQRIIKELGVEGDTPEAQAELISMIGENVLQRIVIEIVKALPEEERKNFEPFIGGGDIESMRQFLLPFIPDLDKFIQHHAQMEYEATKTRMRMIEQGVEG